MYMVANIFSLNWENIYISETSIVKRHRNIRQECQEIFEARLD